jgi:hypothetical protein
MVRRAVQAKHTGSCACLRSAAVQRLRGRRPIDCKRWIVRGWPTVAGGVPPVGDMLVAGGLCRCMLLRDGASCGAGKAHRLLRVPPIGCRAANPRTRARMAAQLGENPRRGRRPRPVGHANPRRLHRPTSFGGPGWPLSWARTRDAAGGRVQSAMQTLGVCIGRQASAGQDGRSVGREPETRQEAASSRPCKPSAFASADKLRRARMAAEALKPDVRAWASEGGSLAQATEHPSGLLRGRDHHRDHPEHEKCKVRAGHEMPRTVQFIVTL